MMWCFIIAVLVFGSDLVVGHEIVQEVVAFSMQTEQTKNMNRVHKGVSPQERERLEWELKSMRYLLPVLRLKEFPQPNAVALERFVEVFPGYLSFFMEVRKLAGEGKGIGAKMLPCVDANLTLLNDIRIHSDQYDLLSVRWEEGQGDKGQPYSTKLTVKKK